MKRQGLGWRQIGRRLGVSATTKLLAIEFGELAELNTFRILEGLRYGASALSGNMVGHMEQRAINQATPSSRGR